jgi:NAD(P)-dependent dehydrogenase (short-subunit alcohol dehydrogenase family)
MTESVAQILTRAGLSQNTLRGQVAVVTGAGRGIGREAARALAWLGAKVVIAELNDVLGTETRELIQRDGGEALFIHTDVSDAESVTALAAETHRAFRTVDILVNNAILCPAVSVIEMDVKLWNDVLAVNLSGTFLTCKTFLPEMLAKKHGAIVNMVSTEAMPGLSAYIATKQGITGFSQSLALELEGQGVHVIPFGPGMVDTPGIRNVAPNLAPRLGMSAEQFLGVSLHPAFDGLMPVEYAGAATAYLIAKLAEEFHGETVTGYEVLERAGVLRSPGAARQVQASSEAGAGSVVSEDMTSAVHSLCGQFAEMIANTEADFNQLPAFVRPIARSGFKGKSGQSIQDWARMAASLGELAKSPETLQAGLASLISLFEKLVSYYQGVPAETARFTKDPEMLQSVVRISQERIALVRRLEAQLEKAAALYRVPHD